jgi:hypothetical protein
MDFHGFGDDDSTAEETQLAFRPAGGYHRIRDGRGATMKRKNESYCSLPISYRQLSEREQIVYEPLARIATILPSSHARILSLCSRLKSIDGHVSDLKSRLGLGATEARAVEAFLLESVERGLLVSAREVMARITSGSAPSDSESRIGIICIPTKNRADFLRRSLTSYLEHVTRWQRNVEFLVTDDSSDPRVLSANQAEIKRSQKRHGIQIRYAGPEQRRAYVTRLAKLTRVPKAIVEYALLNRYDYPVSTGANRNTTLLHSVGQLLLMVDDDTVCRVATAGAYEDRLRFSDSRNPMEFLFYRSHREAIGAVKEMDVDFLGMHERLLGRDVGWLVRNESEILSREALGPEWAKALLRDSGFVPMTMCGVWGDWGIGSRDQFSLFMRNAERLPKGEAARKATMLSRQVLRSAQAYYLAHPGFCMGANLGLDNRRLLPPFHPVQRSEDKLFADLVRLCIPGASTGFLPGGVLHNPEPRKLSLQSLWDSVSLVLSGGLLSSCLDSIPIGNHIAPMERLNSLGMGLEQIGSRKAEDFADLIHGLWVDDCARRLITIESEMAQMGRAPAYWQAYLRKYVKLQREALSRTECLPQDLILPGRDPMTELQNIFMRFGSLLRHWSAIYEGAKALKCEGIQPGVLLK